MLQDGRATTGLFITGTDTDVGKTYVAALIARQLVRSGLHVGAYKPACSGAEKGPDGQPVWNDVTQLCDAIGGFHANDHVCPQRFVAPLAPPVAAQQEGRHVNTQLLRTGARWWQGRVDVLLVEGVGGLLCPLTASESVADLAADLGYPMIVVARLGLGTINHTLLTVEAARNHGLKIAGIVLNEGANVVDDLASATNPPEIVSRCHCPVLGILRRGAQQVLSLDGEPLDIDWRSLSGDGKIAEL